MKVSLFVDIHGRKLVKSAASEFPVNLPTLFREDWVDLEIQLLEPSGTISSPYSVVDISSLSIKVAIGNPDDDPEAFQDTFTADTTTNIWAGNLNINTTEMAAAFTAATGDTIDRYFEIEIEGTSSHFHTVLQQSITLHKDVIENSLVAPDDVTSGSAFATSFAATADDSTTIEWTKTGDYNYAHIIGTSGLSSLTASKFLKVNSGATGFELADGSGSGATDMDGLTDADTTTSAPTTGDHLEWDGSNWVPEAPASVAHTHGMDDLSDADTTTSAPTTGQVLAWDGSSWAPDTNTTPNIWATITADSGTTSANTTSDSLKLAGGEGMDTSISADVCTIAGEDASDTNKGIAKFDSGAFTVASGNVTLDNVAIASGGTGASSKEDGMDALSPLSAAGDVLTHDGSNNVRLAKGSANQVLTMNSAGTAVEWDDEASGSAYTAGDGLDLATTEFSLDLKSAGGLAIDSTELALDVDGLTDLTTTTFGNETFGAGDHIAVADASDSNAIKKVKMPVDLGMAVSDETTDLTTGTGKLTFRMPHAMTLTEVRANVNTAPTGSTIIVDINEGGSTILSTKLAIDVSEKTSTTAATPAVISDTALADDAEMTIDIDQVGSSTAGKGLKVWLIGYR